MPDYIKELSLDELLNIADEHNVDPCDYCKYEHRCNHNAFNNYGYGPVESPCISEPEIWVDDGMLREVVADLLADE